MFGYEEHPYAFYAMASKLILLLFIIISTVILYMLICYFISTVILKISWILLICKSEMGINISFHTVTVDVYKDSVFQCWYNDMVFSSKESHPMLHTIHFLCLLTTVEYGVIHSLKKRCDSSIDIVVLAIVCDSNDSFVLIYIVLYWWIMVILVSCMQSWKTSYISLLYIILQESINHAHSSFYGI
jgi:hypothetical protein